MSLIEIISRALIAIIIFLTLVYGLCRIQTSYMIFGWHLDYVLGKCDNEDIRFKPTHECSVVTNGYFVNNPNIPEEFRRWKNALPYVAIDDVFDELINNPDYRFLRGDAIIDFDPVYLNDYKTFCISYDPESKQGILAAGMEHRGVLIDELSTLLDKYTKY